MNTNTLLWILVGFNIFWLTVVSLIVILTARYTFLRRKVRGLRNKRMKRASVHFQPAEEKPTAKERKRPYEIKR